MDPLTHTLVGASLATTNLGTRTRGAAAALIVGANLPDVDVLSYAAGGDAALGFRRGWTHGVLALAVLPAVLAVGLWLLQRWRRTQDCRKPLSAGWLVALSYLSVLTHPSLDWLNTYGMRWLMPFHGGWFYGDAVFIMDPWLWLILGMAWLAGRRRSTGLLLSWGAFAGLLALVVGLRVAEFLPVVVTVAVAVALLAALLVPPGRGWLSPQRVALTGLAVASLYVAAMIGLQAVTEARVRDDLQRRDLTVDRLMVGPVPVDPFSWHVVLRQGNLIRHGRYRWRGGGSLALSSDLFLAAESSPRWAEILGSGQSPGFLNWARFPWMEEEPAGGGARVYVMDARYVRRRMTGFGGVVVDLPRARAAGQ